MLFDPEPTPSYEDSHTKAALNDLVRWGFIEKEYRCVGEPYARVLDGHSTGGWV